MRHQLVALLGLVLAEGCLDLDALQSGLTDAGGLADAAEVADLPQSVDGGPRTDLPPDLFHSATGCADGRGQDVGGNAPFPVWTCAGIFSGGSLAARCATGFTVCRSIAIGDVVCDGIMGGQYIGRKGYRQPGSFPPDGSQASYTWDGGGAQVRGIMYCGELGAAYAAPAGAGGFFRVLPCDTGGSPTVSSFSCPISAASDADFDLVANDNPSNGVLCCPTSSQ